MGQQSNMPCSLDCSGKFSLVGSADTRSFFRPYFSQARNEPSQGSCVFKINISNIMLAEMALHKFYILILKRYIFYINFFFLFFLNYRYFFSRYFFRRKSFSCRFWPQLHPFSHNLCPVAFIP